MKKLEDPVRNKTKYSSLSDLIVYLLSQWAGDHELDNL